MWIVVLWTDLEMEDCVYLFSCVLPLSHLKYLAVFSLCLTG